MEILMTVSEDYKKQYEIMHASNAGMFPGQQTVYVKGYINNMVTNYNCKTVFDYGCGKGYQYFNGNIHSDWGCSVTLFDIGVPELSNKPNKKFDIVISTDVLEHCETIDIPDILKEINDYATNCVLVSISVREAQKTLPDGRNAHLTVKPKEWWMEQINKVADKPWLILFESEKTAPNQRDFNIESIGINAEDLKVIVE